METHFGNRNSCSPSLHLSPRYLSYRCDTDVPHLISTFWTQVNRHKAHNDQHSCREGMSPSISTFGDYPNDVPDKMKPENDAVHPVEQGGHDSNAPWIDPVREAKLTRKMDIFLVSLMGVSWVARLDRLAIDYHRSYIYWPSWTEATCQYILLQTSASSVLNALPMQWQCQCGKSLNLEISRSER